MRVFPTGPSIAQVIDSSGSIIVVSEYRDIGEISGDLRRRAHDVAAGTVGCAFAHMEGLAEADDGHQGGELASGVANLPEEAPLEAVAAALPK